MKKTGFITALLAFISFCFVASAPAAERQLALLYTGETQGAMLPLFR